MTKLAEQLKQGADQAWESLAEGWRELSARASGALTRFRSLAPGGAASVSAEPVRADEGPLALGGWAFLASDVFHDDHQVVVRIEAPGMRRDDFNIELLGDTLAVWGEKRLDRELQAGRYSIVQCAYGRFRREVRLPVPVQAEKARASYRDGVLRVEMPKADNARARRIDVRSA